MADDGMKWWPHEVDMQSDPKIELLECRYGNEGRWIYGDILNRIYQQTYVRKWEDEDIQTFCRFVLHDQGMFEKVKEMSLYMIEIGLFNKDIFDKYRVITSKKIQSNWLAKKAKGHTEISVDAKYWILDTSQCKIKVNIECSICELEQNTNRTDKEPTENTTTTKTEQSKNTHTVQYSTKQNKDNTEEDTDSVCSFTDADVYRIRDIWNDVFNGTDQTDQSLTLDAVVIHNVKKILKRGTTDADFRRVFEKAKGINFGWTFGMAFGKEANFDQIRAHKPRSNSTNSRESGYSDQRNYNHLYSAKGSNEPLPARYTEEVTI